MANVKITELTEIAATDVAAVDVIPIVDIDQDETKKVSIVKHVCAAVAVLIRNTI